MFLGKPRTVTFVERVTVFVVARLSSLVRIFVHIMFIVTFLGTPRSAIVKTSTAAPPRRSSGFLVALVPTRRRGTTRLKSRRNVIFILKLTIVGRNVYRFTGVDRLSVGTSRSKNEVVITMFVVNFARLCRID